MEQQKQRPMDAWRDMLSPPSSAAITVAVLFYLFSALALALADHRTVSLLFLLCCAVFYYAMSRAFLPLLYYAIPAFLLLACSSLLPAGNALLLPTAFLSLTAGGGSAAFLILHRHDPKRDWPLAILPFLPYLAAALITGDPLRGLLTLLPLALGVTGGVAMLRYTPRTKATLWIAAVLVASLAVAVLATLAACGMLSGDHIASAVDLVRARIVLLFEEAQALYAANGVSLALSDVAISNVAVMLVNLLPGLFLALCAITAFLTWRTLLQMMLAFDTVKRIPLPLSGLTVSPVCAVLYLLVYLISMLATGESVTLFGTVCQNLLLSLVPVLSLVGLASLFGGGAQRSCLSRLLLLAVLLLLFLNPFSALSLAAALGALNILLSRFLPHDNKGEK